MVQHFFLWKCFGGKGSVYFWHIAFITLSEGWMRWWWMSYHIMGALLNELLMLEYTDIVIIFDSDDGYLSTLIIPIVLKYRSSWYLCFFFCFNFEFFSYIHFEFQLLKRFCSEASKLVLTFECCFNDCILWILWHIVCWPKWNNDTFLVFLW